MDQDQNPSLTIGKTSIKHSSSVLIKMKISIGFIGESGNGGVYGEGDFLEEDKLFNKLLHNNHSNQNLFFHTDLQSQSLFREIN